MMFQKTFVANLIVILRGIFSAWKLPKKALVTMQGPRRNFLGTLASADSSCTCGRRVDGQHP